MLGHEDLSGAAKRAAFATSTENSLKLLEKRLIRRPFQETPLGSLRIAKPATSINTQPLRLWTDTRARARFRETS